MKLKKYKNVVKLRNQIANIYFKNLKSIGDIKLFKLNKKNTHSFHQFVIRTKFRNKLAQNLKRNNIQTMVHYPYMLSELKFFGNHKIIKAKDLGKKILSLPISEEHSFKEIYYIINKIKLFFKKKVKY